MGKKPPRPAGSPTGVEGEKGSVPDREAAVMSGVARASGTSPAGGEPSAVAQPASPAPTSTADLSPGDLRAVSAELAPRFPATVDETELVLLDVDPYRAHAYWHLAETDLEAGRDRLGSGGKPAMVLRVHDVTAEDSPGSARWEPFDVEVQGLDGHCYLDLWQDGRSYEVELVLRSRDGRLASLARSNRVDTPRAGPPPEEPPGPPPPRTDAGPSAGRVAPAPEAAPAEVATIVATGAEASLSPPAAAADTAPPPTTAVEPPSRPTAGASPAPPATAASMASAPPAWAAQATPPTTTREWPAPPSDAGGSGPAPAGEGVPAEIQPPPEPSLAPPVGEVLSPEFPNTAPETAYGGTTGGVEVPAYAAVEGVLLPETANPPDDRSEGAPATVHPSPEGGPLAEAETGVPPILTFSSASLAEPAALLELHAELHVFGRAKPGSRLRIFGRPVALRPDGSFSLRRPLPAGAVVLPLDLSEDEPGTPQVEGG
jgi:hypothetical protein